MDFSAHGSTSPKLTEDGVRTDRPTVVEIKKSSVIKDTKATFTKEALIKLAAKMISPFDFAKQGEDDEENPYIPAGFTYLGQFIDHDLTFDDTSTIHASRDPAIVKVDKDGRVVDGRTPRFDLDNVFGGGPDEQPYLYDDANGVSLLMGKVLINNVPDVLRNIEGRAMIGDKRNDENAIVVQIHAAFIRFYNAMVHRGLNNLVSLPEDDTKLMTFPTSDDLFTWARQETRWHYHRIILDDFLPRLISAKATHAMAVLADLKAGKQPAFKLFDIATPYYMPAEFAGAAYRFGHSMIRPGYQLAPGGKEKLFAIFAGENEGLRGFKKLNENNAIDWRLFFSEKPVPGQKLTNAERAENNQKNGLRTQFSYKIDSMLVDPLGTLPLKVSGDPIVSLAERNLLRGQVYELPSGEQMAGIFGVEPIHSDFLRIRMDNDFGKPETLVQIDEQFEKNTPLWFYVLAEAENELIHKLLDDKKALPISLGTQLGDVGGGIVAETFSGLLYADKDCPGVAVRSSPCAGSRNCPQRKSPAASVST